MTIEIKIPSDNKPLAAAIGAALVAYGNDSATVHVETTNEMRDELAGEFGRPDIEAKIPASQGGTMIDDEPLNEYEVLAENLGAENVKKTGVHIGKAIGVYEQNVLNAGGDPLGLDALTVLLVSADYVDITSAETILNAIYEATKPIDTSAAFSQSAGTATAPGSTTETSHTATATTGAELDEKGVAFNAEMCGKAAKPFYGSGKNKGQWKKKQGLDQAIYDAWYASALAEVRSGETVDTETGEINTAAAFTQTKTDEPQLQSMGDLFTWISEMQNAERLTQADVDAAYKEAGATHGDGNGPITMNDLIKGNESRGLTALGSINLIYSVLAKKAG